MRDSRTFYLGTLGKLVWALLVCKLAEEKKISNTIEKNLKHYFQRKVSKNSLTRDCKIKVWLKETKWYWVLLILGMSTEAQVPVVQEKHSMLFGAHKLVPEPSPGHRTECLNSQSWYTWAGHVREPLCTFPRELECMLNLEGKKTLMERKCRRYTGRELQLKNWQ